MIGTYMYEFNNIKQPSSAESHFGGSFLPMADDIPPFQMFLGLPLSSIGVHYSNIFAIFPPQCIAPGCSIVDYCLLSYHFDGSTPTCSLIASFVCSHVTLVYCSVARISLPQQCLCFACSIVSQNITPYFTVLPTTVLYTLSLLCFLIPLFQRTEYSCLTVCFIALFIFHLLH